MGFTQQNEHDSIGKWRFFPRQMGTTPLIKCDHNVIQRLINGDFSGSPASALCARPVRSLPASQAYRCGLGEKNEDFCTENDDFCIKTNDEFCINMCRVLVTGKNSTRKLAGVNTPLRQGGFFYCFFDWFFSIFLLVFHWRSTVLRLTLTWLILIYFDTGSIHLVWTHPPGPVICVNICGNLYS